MFNTFLHGNQELAGTKREREEEEEGSGKRWSGREREKAPTGAAHAESRAYLRVTALTHCKPLYLLFKDKGMQVIMSHDLFVFILKIR